MSVINFKFQLRKVKIGESLVNVREKRDRTEEDNRNHNTVNISAALRYLHFNDTLFFNFCTHTLSASQTS